MNEIQLLKSRLFLALAVVVGGATACTSTLQGLSERPSDDAAGPITDDRGAGSPADATLADAPADPPPDSSPPQGLQMHLRLDEGSGNSAKDATGQGHEAALRHGPSWVAGRIGGGLSFDEVDDHATVQDFAYHGADGATIALWFNTAKISGTAYQYLFSHGRANEPHSISVVFYEGENPSGDAGRLNTVVMDRDDTQSPMLAPAGLADGAWHLYVLTLEPGQGATVYVDGKVAAQGPSGGDPIDPPGPIFLGGRADLDPQRFYGGALDEVRIYDRALSAAEVVALFEAAPTIGGTCGDGVLDEGEQCDAAADACCDPTRCVPLADGAPCPGGACASGACQQQLAPPDHTVSPGVYDPMQKIRPLIASGKHLRLAAGKHTWSQPLDWDGLKGRIDQLVISGEPGGGSMVQYGGSYSSDLINYQPTRPEKLPTQTTLTQAVPVTPVEVPAPSPSDEIGPFGTVTRTLGIYSDAKQVTVADASGLAAGDLIYIQQQNDAAFLAEIAPPPGWPVSAYTNTGQSLRRVLARIASKSGNTLQLEHGVLWAFKAGAAVKKVTDYMSGFVIRDLTIEGTDRFGVVADSRDDHVNPIAGFENDAALRIDSCYGCRFSNLVLNNLPSSAIQFWYHLAWQIDQVTVNKVHNMGGGGNGYCFYYLDAYHGVATGLEIRGFRHGVVTKLGNAGGKNSWTVDLSEKGNTFDYHGCAGGRETFRVKQVSNRLNGHRFTDYDFPISSVRTWAHGNTWPPGWPFNETSTLYVDNAEFDESRYHYPKLTRDWDPIETDDIYGDRSLQLNAGADAGTISLHGGRRFDIDNPAGHDDVTIRITPGPSGSRRNDHRIRARNGKGWTLQMDHVSFAQVKITVSQSLTKIYQDGPSSSADKHAIRLEGVQRVVDKTGAVKRWTGAAWQDTP